MKKWMGIAAIFIVLNIVLLYYGVLHPVTFTELEQNPKVTMSKYEQIWNDTTITEKNYTGKSYKIGDVVGTITIPSLEIYEMPVYYGETDENKNWQLTTSGYESGWRLFGEYGITAVSAYNYQLFKELPKIDVGEKFIVETDDDVYVYVVQSESVFEHENQKWEDAAFLDKEPYSVNLITNYPINVVDTEDRYIVYATIQRGTIFPDSNTNPQ